MTATLELEPRTSRTLDAVDVAREARKRAGQAAIDAAVAWARDQERVDVGRLVGVNRGNADHAANGDPVAAAGHLARLILSCPGRNLRPLPEIVRAKLTGVQSELARVRRERSDADRRIADGSVTLDQYELVVNRASPLIASLEEQESRISGFIESWGAGLREAGETLVNGYPDLLRDWSAYRTDRSGAPPLNESAELRAAEARAARLDPNSTLGRERAANVQAVRTRLESERKAEADRQLAATAELVEGLKAGSVDAFVEFDADVRAEPKAFVDGYDDAARDHILAAIVAAGPDIFVETVCDYA